MRNLLAIFVGAVIGSATLLLVGMVANAISPTPPEPMDPHTPDAVAQRVDAASLSTWITVIFGLALGAFFGGGVAAGMAKEKTARVAGGVGALLSLWAVYTFFVVYPAVLWVPVAMLVVVFSFSYLGGQAAGRLRGKVHV